MNESFPPKVPTDKDRADTATKQVLAQDVESGVGDFSNEIPGRQPFIPPGPVMPPPPRSTAAPTSGLLAGMAGKQGEQGVDGPAGAPANNSDDEAFRRYIQSVESNPAAMAAQGRLNEMPPPYQPPPSNRVANAGREYANQYWAPDETRLVFSPNQDKYGPLATSMLPTEGPGGSTLPSSIPPPPTQWTSTRMPAPVNESMTYGTHPEALRALQQRLAQGSHSQPTPAMAGAQGGMGEQGVQGAAGPEAALGKYLGEGDLGGATVNSSTWGPLLAAGAVAIDPNQPKSNAGRPWWDVSFHPEDLSSKQFEARRKTLQQRSDTWGDDPAGARRQLPAEDALGAAVPPEPGNTPVDVPPPPTRGPQGYVPPRPLSAQPPMQIVPNQIVGPEPFDQQMQGPEPLDQQMQGPTISIIPPQPEQQAALTNYTNGRQEPSRWNVAGKQSYQFKNMGDAQNFAGSLQGKSMDELAKMFDAVQTPKGAMSLADGIVQPVPTVEELIQRMSPKQLGDPKAPTYAEANKIRDDMLQTQLKQQEQSRLSKGLEGFDKNGKPIPGSAEVAAGDQDLRKKGLEGFDKNGKPIPGSQELAAGDLAVREAHQRLLQNQYDFSTSSLNEFLKYDADRRKVDPTISDERVRADWDTLQKTFGRQSPNARVGYNPNNSVTDVTNQFQPGSLAGMRSLEQTQGGRGLTLSGNGSVPPGANALSLAPKDVQSNVATLFEGGKKPPIEDLINTLLAQPGDWASNNPEIVKGIIKQRYPSAAALQQYLSPSGENFWKNVARSATGFSTDEIHKFFGGKKSPDDIQKELAKKILGDPAEEGGQMTGMPGLLTGAPISAFRQYVLGHTR